MDDLALGFLFERTTRIIKLRFHQLFNDENIDITPEQWVVLDILSKNKVLSQKEISDISFKDAPSVSRLLLGLINKGFIEKEILNSDKRVSNICLTIKGKEAVAHLKPKVKALREIGIKNISDQESLEFVRFINQVFENYS